jgi:hypothetical protein
MLYERAITNLGAAEIETVIEIRLPSDHFHGISIDRQFAARIDTLAKLFIDLNLVPENIDKRC